MCPDDPVLSSFHDHELPPGSAERIEAHLAGCEHCRTRLRRFQSVSHRLIECEEPDVEEAAIRVWRRLDAQAPASAGRRRGSLRLPIAAASAALAVAFVFTLALGDRPPALDEWGRAALSRLAAVPEDPVAPYGAERAVVMETDAPEYQRVSTLRRAEDSARGRVAAVCVGGVRRLRHDGGEPATRELSADRIAGHRA